MKTFLLTLLLAIQIFANTANEAVNAYKKQDFAKAEKLFKKCADNGNKKCSYALGGLYYEALNFLQNPMNNAPMNKNKPSYDKMAPKVKSVTDKLKFFYDNAIKYLKQSDIPRSNALIGEMYMSGLSYMVIPIYQPDYKKAKYYFNLAINSDDKIAVSVAANDLGLMYMNGNGVLQDFSKAEQLLKKATKGLDIAYCNLGSLYALKNNITLAKKYLKIGYEKGVELCAQIWNENNLGQ